MFKTNSVESVYNVMIAAFARRVKGRSVLEGMFFGVFFMLGR
jgi:hypothetical protein